MTTKKKTSKVKSKNTRLRLLFTHLTDFNVTLKNALKSNNYLKMIKLKYITFRKHLFLINSVLMMILQDMILVFYRQNYI